VDCASLIDQAAAGARHFGESRLSLGPLASDPAIDPALASAFKLIADGMTLEEVVQAVHAEAKLRAARDSVRVALITTAVTMIYGTYPEPVVRSRLRALANA
jgi:hypothetical protein